MNETFLYDIQGLFFWIEEEKQIMGRSQFSKNYGEGSIREHVTLSPNFLGDGITFNKIFSRNSEK